VHTSDKTCQEKFVKETCGARLYSAQLKCYENKFNWKTKHFNVCTCNNLKNMHVKPNSQGITKRKNTKVKNIKLVDLKFQYQ
jgi:hypothetical protein